MLTGERGRGGRRETRGSGRTPRMLNRLACSKDQDTFILYGEDTVCNAIVSRDSLRHFDIDDASRMKLDGDSRAEFILK